MKYIAALAVLLLLPRGVLALENAPCVAVSRYLVIGSRGMDVAMVQNYFISQKYLGTGLATGYFGPLTQTAVMQFQKDVGIVSNGSPNTTGYGAVGPKTRAALAVCNTQVAPTSAPAAPTAPVVPSKAPISPPLLYPAAVLHSTDIILPSTSAQYASVAADTKSVTLSAFKFRPDLEAIHMNQIGLTLASGATGDIHRITLWANAHMTDGVLVGDSAGALTLIGTTVPTDSSTMIVVLNPLVQFPKNQDTTVWVAGDVAPIGTGQTGHSGNLLQINLAAAETKGTGKDSGRVQTILGSPTVPGKRIFRSVPAFTYATEASRASNGSNDLLALTVSADAKGDITLGRVTFYINLTGATANAFSLSGPNGIVHASATIASSGSALAVAFDSTTNAQDATIAAGTSKTYILRVHDLAFTSTGGSITAGLKADTAFAGMSTFAALSSSNIVWSPNSNGGPTSPSTADWANGYGLPGCFASAGLGSDCPTRTLTN